MTERVRTVEFGFFPVPYAQQAAELVAHVQLAEALGYDLVGIQDHPYQRRFLDTFVLLPWLAAATERIRFFTDVAHLPLRPPAMLAKQAASLDVLSGGRFELGLGAGGFAQASQAMGAPAREGADALEALEEAIAIIRRFWEAPERGITHEGPHYRLGGVKAGPRPAHDIGIWVGGYGPRMLEMIGRVADGWVPSAPHWSHEKLLDKQRRVSQAAVAAGRNPADIRRILNIGGPASQDNRTRLSGPVEESWVDALTELAASGFDTFVLWVDGDVDEQLRAFAEVAERVRAD
jgi:alkanesulfonate monooxygenase SsuD/methylene tetrahydromethanopterin reductase-like flavin-dependent oxidoreductase (luciferase family)